MHKYRNGTTSGCSHDQWPEEIRPLEEVVEDLR
jgi:hypothetical protein